MSAVASIAPAVEETTFSELHDEAYFRDLASRGMLFSHWAKEYGAAPAILSPRGNRSFTELNGNANRLLYHLRASGLSVGSPVAIVCGNIPQFVEAVLACQRGGFRFTPVNWHLAPDEVAYILNDCAAEAWIVQGEFADKVASADPVQVRTRLAVGPAVPGFDDYAAALAAQPAHDPDDAVLGKSMLYTSGTTGRPKGVVKGATWVLLPQREGTGPNYRKGDLNLLCGPAYHGGPLTFDIAYPLASGAGILLMEKFDASQVLTLIERYRVTHSHMVSTMFQRLLALPEKERRDADLSSMRMLIHGAAPTPPEVKHAMIDWFGPILFEYYAATEASANIKITSEEWLRKPGSVGRIPESGACVLDENGIVCPPGVAGRICFLNPAGARTQYYNAEEKNREVFAGEHFTVGDIGYLDEDGYLFLTGRSAETIISGGVNIYPQEIDNVLLRHPAVRQSATVGIPNREWGEEVRGVVSLHSGIAPGPALADELIALVRGELAGYKVPRAIDFVEEIPQSEAGKVQRVQVRAEYWRGMTARSEAGTPTLSASDAAAFKEAMARLAATVHLITTEHAGQRFGMTVTAACSLSADPMSVVICVNRDASAHAAILASRRLKLNILASDHAALAARFAGAGGHQGESRFEEGRWSEGCPGLAGAVAVIDLDVATEMSFGTHTILACTVRGVELGERSDPLIYANRSYAALAQAA